MQRPLYLALVVIHLVVMFEISFCVNFVAVSRTTWCAKRRNHIYMFVHSEQRCTTMGGYYTGGKCQMYLCEIPPSGRIANGDIWAICPKGASSSIFAKTYMRQKYCDDLQGSWTGNSAKIDDYVECWLRWCKYSGAERKYIEGIVFAPAGQCSGSKVGEDSLTMRHRDCGRLDGTWLGTRGYSDLGKCLLDTCSPINCEPRDEWVDIKQCGDLTSGSELTCTYTETVGIKRVEESSSSRGGSASSSVEASVGFELGGIFAKVSSSLTVGYTTGFDWAKTMSSSSTFSKTVTNELSVVIPPGKTVKIQQVIGFCGDFRVYADAIRIVEVE